MNENIFRQYDIRGIYEKDLTDEISFLIGKGIGKILENFKNKTIIVGHDARLSGKNLYENLIDGLITSGVNVMKIGLVPTPVLYFACYSKNVAGGIIITGSHNPKDYNGFKIVINKKPFFGKEIQKLKNIIIKKDFINGNGKIFEKNIEDDYINYILKIIQIPKTIENFKVIFDGANGATGNIINKLSEKLTFFIPTFTNFDGNFPNHHPDPSKEENLVNLKKNISKHKANLGIMFDGDGDRVAFVDEKEEILELNRSICLFSQTLQKNSTIVLDIKCSYKTIEYLKSKNFNIIISKTGHPFIKEAIIKNNASFGAELSGHIFYKDEYFGFDDGIFAALKMIKLILELNSKSLNQEKKKLPHFFSSNEITIQSSDDKKFHTIDLIKEIIKMEGKKYEHIDGIKVYEKNGTWLLRASNTTPSIVMVCDSDCKENIEILKEKGMNYLNKVALKL